MPPHILLIPDKYNWILGTISKQIVQYNPEYHFAYSTRPEVLASPSKVIELSRNIDVIHWVLDLEFYENLPIELKRFPKQIASVHHVLNWEKAQKCREAALIHVVSQEWKDFLIDKGIDEERIWLIPNGIDIARFNPDTPCNEARKKLTLPESAFIVGFLGSAFPTSRERKGVDTFIAACNILASQIPELVVFISGQYWDDDVKKLRANGIKVIHPGYLSDQKLPLAYRAMDVFIVAGTVEGGPVTAFEALASGIPLVSTPVGMVRDGVEDGKQALIFSANNVDEMASNVMWIYCDGALSRNLRINGPLLIREKYQWKDIAPRYGKLYAQLADPPSESYLNQRTDPFINQRLHELKMDKAILISKSLQNGKWRVASDLFLDDHGSFLSSISVLLLVVKNLISPYLQRSIELVKRLIPSGIKNWLKLRIKANGTN